MNPLSSIVIEYHILQSFPCTCLNADDAGMPKSCIVGGVLRSRVSSQSWKRQVRLTLHRNGFFNGIRTRYLADLVKEACCRLNAPEERAALCADSISSALAKEELFFLSREEIERIAFFAAEQDFFLPDELSGKQKSRLALCLKKPQSCAEGLDIALFGRMAAQDSSVSVQASAAFSHAFSTHKAVVETDSFTAMDDVFRLTEREKAHAGAAYLGSQSYCSATYYRYISLDLAQLWENLGGVAASVADAVEGFSRALYLAVPAGKQNAMSGACPWDYAHILVRRGQKMQLAFVKPVPLMADGGIVERSVSALEEGLAEQERLSGSMYGCLAKSVFGKGHESIDAVCQKLLEAVEKCRGEA